MRSGYPGSAGSWPGWDGGPAGQAPGHADRWQVEVVHQAADGQEAVFSVVVAGAPALAPTFLSCGDGVPKAETHYETLAFSPVP